jgi:hypothetical protein
MKKVKMGLIALAVTIGVAGAFASTHRASKPLTNPNWQQADASGNVVIGGAYYYNQTLSEAQSDFGCSGAKADCAVTVTGQDGSPTSPAEYIKHNN